MKNLFLSLAVTAFFGLAACTSEAGSESANQGESATKYSVADLTSDIDPVCNMKLTDQMIAATADHHGGVYGFCAEGCKKAFLKDPHAYISH